jgi:methanogenic corrinoid protein MtbC1
MTAYDSTDKSVLKKGYLGDLLAAKRKAALERIMAAFRNGYPIPDIYVDIFQQSLYEIGQLWETNRISVADEHMGTAITQFIMANLYQHLEMADTERGRLVITGVQGELHQVGANMVSDILEADGWDVMFLGTNVPPENVIQSIRQHRADLLGISVTLLMNIPAVITLVSMVKQEFGDRTLRILLGGSAISSLLELPRELEGCMLARDLREARELTRTIVRNGDTE